MKGWCQEGTLAVNLTSGKEFYCSCTCNTPCCFNFTTPWSNDDTNSYYATGENAHYGCKNENFPNEFHCFVNYCGFCEPVDASVFVIIISVSIGGFAVLAFHCHRFCRKRFKSSAATAPVQVVGGFGAAPMGMQQGCGVAPIGVQQGFGAQPMGMQQGFGAQPIMMQPMMGGGMGMPPGGMMGAQQPMGGMMGIQPMQMDPQQMQQQMMMQQQLMMQQQMMQQQMMQQQQQPQQQWGFATT